LNPDEQVASLLEATATAAQRRGGAAAAALAMERAAELSPDPEDQARRLVSAASAAVPAGQADWVQDFTARALAVSADPELRLAARRDAGWALAYSSRRAAALPALISVAEEASRDQPALAWDALSDAAIVAYHSGTTASCQAVSRVLGVIDNQECPAAGHGPRAEADSHRLWIRACTDPFGSRSELVDSVRQISRSPLDEAALWRVGSAAWLLDESDLAITLLQDAMHRLRAPGTRGTSGPGLTALGWLYIDTGRWDEALEAATEAAGFAQTWAQRTEAELRACGVTLPGASAECDALGELTPQQRQIVRLASDGLTNREIGDRLFLSPRTVGSHLYRSFPKLGVADRHQLRDVITRTSP
jgi:DNA-binding CsgD family transcriptional regulator